MTKRPPRTPRPEGVALTAAPTNALTVWCDAHRLYVEVRTQSGPRVLTYDLTASGLSAALALIRGRPFDFPGTPVHGPFNPNSLDSTRAQAEQIIRRMGLIR